MPFEGAKPFVGDYTSVRSDGGARYRRLEIIHHTPVRVTQDSLTGDHPPPFASVGVFVPDCYQGFQAVGVGLEVISNFLTTYFGEREEGGWLVGPRV